ncbi:lipoprotein [Hoeflea sp. BAL378]|nr:lipoprotein [Hoeflea sp. BAL378]
MILSSILAASVASPAFAANPSCGRASWYALTSKTASGERMDPAKLTAAHPRLSFGTRVKVTNPRNGKTVVVRINDRGPFVKGRIIDVSKAAAGQLGMINSGVAKVCFHVVS